MEISLSYRYPGVKPFNTAEEEIFYGREKDIKDFFDFIATRQISVLYGKSGLGKSSLINAGIIPLLNSDPSYKNNFQFFFRFNNFVTKELNISPLDNVHLRLQQEIAPDYKENASLSLITSQQKNIWYCIKTLQKSNAKATIYLFFDQFEELFTYPIEQIKAFSEEIADAIYTPIPVKFRAALAKIENEEANHDNLDWIYERPLVKLIFSIRSDRMSLLDMISDRHPSLLTNWYELKPLSQKDATLAIIEPAKIINAKYKSPPFKYEPDLVEKMINSFNKNDKAEIETNILQIICRYIEESQVLGLNKTIIKVSDVGEIENVLYRYYEDTLAKLSPKARYPAQKLIEEQLITNDQRNPLSETYIKEHFLIDDELLNTLELSSILRKERDSSGRFLYEVGHDTLIEPIKKVSKKRRELEEELKEAERNKELERKLNEEKKRVQELEHLYQKIRSGRTTANIAIFLSLIAAGIAGIFFLNANKEKNEANKERIAAYQNLKSLNYQKAQELYNLGKQYNYLQEYALARSSYLNALQYLDSALNRQIMVEDSMISKLRKDLQSKIIQ